MDLRLPRLRGHPAMAEDIATGAALQSVVANDPLRGLHRQD